METARRENRSVSELVREIISDWMKQQDEQRLWRQRMEALERLRAVRERIQEERGIYEGDLLGEARDERDEDMDRVWRGKE